MRRPTTPRQIGVLVVMPLGRHGAISQVRRGLHRSWLRDYGLDLLLLTFSRISADSVSPFVNNRPCRSRVSSVLGL